MSTSESEPAMITTPRTESASETSYETSCAHVRIEPRSEYFDSDDQPPMMKPQIPGEPSAKTRSRAIETLAISPSTCQRQRCQPAPNGMTLKAARAVNIETTGATM